MELIGRLPARELPVIIVVSACEECSRMALRAGASGYLLKPVSPNSLRGVIDMLRTRPRGRDVFHLESEPCIPRIPIGAECRHHAAR